MFRFYMTNVFLQREQILQSFCLWSRKTNSYMEAGCLLELYKILVFSNEGDLSPHVSQTIYFSKNKWK